MSVKGLTATIWSASKTAAILLVAAGGCILASIATAFFPAAHVYGILLMLISLGLVLITAQVAKRYTRTKTEEKLRGFQAHCRETKEWLASLGVTAPAQIEQCRSRLAARLEAQTQARQKSAERRNRWMQILVIPCLLAALAAVLRMEEDPQQILVDTLVVVLVAGLVSVLVIAVQRLVTSLASADWIPEQSLQEFLDDLQGVLDTQF